MSGPVVALERPPARTPKPRSIRSCAMQRRPATRGARWTGRAESALAVPRGGAALTPHAGCPAAHQPKSNGAEHPHQPDKQGGPTQVGIASMMCTLQTWLMTPHCSNGRVAVMLSTG